MQQLIQHTCQALLDLIDQRFLGGHIRTPFLERLQSHQKFGVEKTRGIGAVVRPPQLGGRADDLRKWPEDAANLRDKPSGLFERNIYRESEFDQVCTRWKASLGGIKCENKPQDG